MDFEEQLQRAEKLSAPSLVGSSLRSADDSPHNNYIHPEKSHNKSPSKLKNKNNLTTTLDDLINEGALIGSEEDFDKFLDDSGHVKLGAIFTPDENESKTLDVSEESSLVKPLNSGTTRKAVPNAELEKTTPESALASETPASNPQKSATSDLYSTPNLSEYQLDNQIRDASDLVASVKSIDPQKLPKASAYKDLDNSNLNKKPLRPKHIDAPEINFNDQESIRSPLPKDRGLHTPYFHTDDLRHGRSRSISTDPQDRERSRSTTAKPHLARGDSYKNIHEEEPSKYELPADLQETVDETDERQSRHARRTMSEKIENLEKQQQRIREFHSEGNRRDPSLVTTGDYTNFNVDLPESEDFSHGDSSKLYAQRSLSSTNYLRSISRSRSRVKSHPELDEKNDADPGELVREGAFVSDDPYSTIDHLDTMVEEVLHMKDKGTSLKSKSKLSDDGKSLTLESKSDSNESTQNVEPCSKEIEGKEDEPKKEIETTNKCESVLKQEEEEEEKEEEEKEKEKEEEEEEKEEEEKEKEKEEEEEEKEEEEKEKEKEEEEEEKGEGEEIGEEKGKVEGEEEGEEEEDSNKTPVIRATAFKEDSGKLLDSIDEPCTQNISDSHDIDTLRDTLETKQNEIPSNDATEETSKADYSTTNELSSPEAKQDKEMANLNTTTVDKKEDYAKLGEKKILDEIDTISKKDEVIEDPEADDTPKIEKDLSTLMDELMAQLNAESGVLSDNVADLTSDLEPSRKEMETDLNDVESVIKTSSSPEIETESPETKPLVLDDKPDTTSQEEDKLEIQRQHITKPIEDALCVGVAGVAGVVATAIHNNTNSDNTILKSDAEDKKVIEEDSTAVSNEIRKGPNEKSDADGVVVEETLDKVGELDKSDMEVSDVVNEELENVVKEEENTVAEDSKDEGENINHGESDATLDSEIKEVSGDAIDEEVDSSTHEEDTSKPITVDGTSTAGDYTSKPTADDEMNVKSIEEPQTEKSTEPANTSKEVEEDDDDFNVDDLDISPEEIRKHLESLPVYIYTSLAGGMQVIQRTNRLITILNANGIKYECRDLGTDEDAKKLWKRQATGKTLPGVVRGDDFIGNWKEIDDANEEFRLQELLYETF
jgi:hypothetical protein